MCLNFQKLVPVSLSLSLEDCPQELLLRARCSSKGSYYQWLMDAGKLRTFLITVVAVQSISHVWLFATPWTSTHQASLSLTISQSLPKLMYIASVMPSSHLILWRPPFLLPSIFSSIRDFSNESTVHIRWPKYWRFNVSISPSNKYSRVDFP